MEGLRTQVKAAEKTEAELLTFKSAGKKAADALKFDEQTTRQRLIDKQLNAVGWNVDPNGGNTEEVGQEVEVPHQPTESGIGYADYILWDDTGKPLAVIEAKKTSVSPENGRIQAKIYADGLEEEHGQRPVIFYTNGFDIYIWDDTQGYPPRQLFGFYSKDSLQYLVRQRQTRRPLDTVEPKKEIIGERLYQIQAIQQVCERFSNNHRKVLIVQATGTGKEFRRIFKEDEQDLRWSHFKEMPAETMLPHMRDKVFPHFQKVAVEGARFGEYMQDAQLLIQKPSLLVIAVLTIDKLPLTSGDTKGDLYEYMLGKLTTAGIAGQFRTPRHIITKMVEMLAPRPDEIIGDPACGTAGFLVQTMHYLLKEYTSPEMVYEDESGEKVYPGDKLEPHRKHIQSGMFHGFDFDITMLQIAAMNLLLHNIETPDIHYMDTLSNRFPERFKGQSEGFFDVIMANPPFKGSLDYDDVHPSLLKKVKTKKTELLFVALILKMLKTGGRSATIVPDGVLFGSSNAHQASRKMLVDDNQLDAVISLPSGVFKPYAGVSTAVIVFTRGGRTDQVFYYDVQADGFSLDDKREPQPDKDDLPEMLVCWQKRDPKKDTDKTQKHFFVDAEEIRKNKYDLSINRYKEIVYEEEEYDPPEEILARMVGLEKEIMADMEELRGMLG